MHYNIYRKGTARIEEFFIFKLESLNYNMSSKQFHSGHKGRIVISIFSNY
jgi:hypothetical protein